MLSNITWWQFIATILILLLLYYPIILWLFFKKEIYNLFQKHHADVNDSSADEEKETDTPEEPVSLNNEPATHNASQAGMVADLMQDITTAVTQTIDDNGTKEELLSLIRVLLKRYSILKDSGQRVQINEFIIEECKRFPINLTLIQAYGLWTYGEPSSK